jgi:hypothetical protein
MENCSVAGLPALFVISLRSGSPKWRSLKWGRGPSTPYDHSLRERLCCAQDDRNGESRDGLKSAI